MQAEEMQAEKLISPPDQPVSDDVLEMLRRLVDEPRTLASESPIHRIADSHIERLKIAVRYAFAKGRAAVDKGKLKNATSRSQAEDAMHPAYAAVELALQKVLPGTLLRIVAEGGQVALKMLPKLKVAGDFEGHPFRGNQWTSYHGTSIEAATKIKAEGLRPGRHDGKVYTAKELPLALSYAANASGKRDIAERLEAEVAVVVLHKDAANLLPRKFQHGVSMAMKGIAFEGTEHIPATLVKEVRIYKVRDIHASNIHRVDDRGYPSKTAKFTPPKFRLLAEGLEADPDDLLYVFPITATTNVFDLSSLTETQASWITEALSRCTFDFSLLTKSQIPVVFLDFNGKTPQSDPAFVYGNARYEGEAAIEIDAALNQNDAMLTFVSEAAHLVDFFYLSDEQRAQILAAYAEANPSIVEPRWFFKTDDPSGDRYYEQVGESFMNGFTLAFSDLPVTDDDDYEARSTPAVVEMIREVLGMKALGGPGSGNFGHSGRPGEVGGSGDSVGFHGTSIDRLDSILKDGIKPDSNGNAWAIAELASAQEYATLRMRTRKQGSAAVLEVHIPPGVTDSLLSDGASRFEGFSTYAVKGGIRPEWIKAVHTLDAKQGTWKIRGLAASDGLVVFVPVFSEEPEGNAELRTAKPAPKPLAIKFNVKNPAVVKAANRHAAKLIKELTETTRKEVHDAVHDAVVRIFEEPDGNFDDAYDDILKAVGSEARADMIARTETMAAANRGQLEAWGEAVEEGLLTGDERKTWIATEVNACSECEELNEETVALDEQFPGGYDAPPAHPNCRCTLGMVSA